MNISSIYHGKHALKSIAVKVEEEGCGCEPGGPEQCLPYEMKEARVARPKQKRQCRANSHRTSASQRKSVSEQIARRTAYVLLRAELLR